MPSPHGLGSVGDCSRRWLAAYTRHQHEMKVAQQLRQSDVRCLVPTFYRFSRWSDRLKKVEAPLFPGYVFVRVSEAERLILLRTPGVISVVCCAGKAAAIPDADIERLHACAAHPELVEPHAFLQIGQKVRIRRGPFASWEGVLVEKRNTTRLVIAFEQIARSISVDVHTADVEQIA